MSSNDVRKHIGYPMTKRKKIYLHNLISQSHFFDIGLVCQIECVFEFERFVCDFYEELKIIYSIHNDSNYYKLEIKQDYNSKEYQCDVSMNIVDENQSIDIYNYVIDRNIILEEDKYKRHTEDPFEIPHFISLIEDSLSKLKYKFFGIKFHRDKLVKENEWYSLIKNENDVRKDYDSLEEFIVDNMK